MVSKKQKKQIKQKKRKKQKKQKLMGTKSAFQSEEEKPVEIETGIKEIAVGFAKLQSVLEQNEGSPISFTMEEYMNIYSNIFKLCFKPPERDHNAARLYEAYLSGFTAYFSSSVLPSLRRCGESAADAPLLLRELERRWVNHTVMVQWLSRLLSYLDRSYLPLVDLPGLHESGLMSFKEGVFAHIKAKAIEAILSALERDRDRDGSAADLALVRSVTATVFSALEEDYTGEAVEATGEYYRQKAARWVEAGSFPEYMEKAEEALVREAERALSYFQEAESWSSVVDRARRELLVTHWTRLSEDEASGFRALVRGDKTDDIKRLFRLYVELPDQTEQAAALFRNHMMEEGMGVVESGDQEAIKKLIGLHSKYRTTYLRDCFGNNDTYAKAVSEAFDTLANTKIDRVPVSELLAGFCDDLLRKGGSGEKMSDDGVEEILENVIQFTTCVKDKDVFVECCRKKLSRRLLFGRSSGSDRENCLVGKLKRQFGIPYSMKQEGMIYDMVMGKENDEAFKNYHKHDSLGLDLSVTVLTTNNWPSYQSSDIVLPPEMARCADAFAEFYRSKYGERRLTYVYSLGTCTVQGRFESKRIELVVSTYQAAVLMLFSGRDRLAYSEIAAELNMENYEDDLGRVLHSLSCAKYKILRKEPESRTVSKDDNFSFNYKFSNPLRRIKIPLPPAAEPERKTVNQVVDKNRVYNIDAAIVRIMKGRKALNYQQLIAACIDLLTPSFQPEVRSIKKRIENLIDREFLERDKDDPNLFLYLA